MLMGLAGLEGKREQERERNGRAEKTAKKTGATGPGNRCVHIIPPVLLISSKNPTPRHLEHPEAEACSLSLSPSPPD
jgi:hypothetical protein